MTPADWTGRVGETWAAEWRRTDRSFAGLDPALDAAIAATAADRPVGTASLDIGCGAGTTSLAIAAARPDLDVTGVDLSPDLVSVATARAAERGIAARFLTGDAVERAGEAGRPSLLFSRHGVMFFADPVAAFRRLGEAAAPDATLVFSCFADAADNRWATDTVPDAPPPGTAPGPFAFADPGRVASILGAAGWRAPPPRRVAFDYVAGAGTSEAAAVADALRFFRRIGPAARALRDAEAAGDPEARAALLDRLASTCAAWHRGGVIAFPATAWLWTAAREKLG